MLKIDKNKFKINFKNVILTAIILLAAWNYDIAQNDQTPLNIFNTPSNGNFYDLIDFGKSYIYSTSGEASYYGNKFHMRKTSNGERYNKNDHSAAHRKLPFGTILRVTNLKNQKSTLVRINDRGPFIRKRIIDLSRAAAKDIDGLGLPKVNISGFVPKKVDVQNPENYYIAYSTFDEPSIFTKDIFESIGSYKSFQNVFDDYQYLVENNPSFENNLFVLLSLDEYNTTPSKTEYQLGYFKSFEPKRIPFNIAERDKK